MKNETRTFFGGLGKKPERATAGPVAAARVTERFNQLPPDPDAVIVRCDLVVVKPQARKHFSQKKLEELAANIATQGQLQPIVIWHNPEDEYELIAGERRLRAIRDVLKRKEVRARITRDLKEAEKIAYAQLSENLQREAYEAMDLAEEFDRLKRAHGLSNAVLAKEIGGVSESFVSKYLSLLTAPSDVQEAIRNGELAATSYFNNKEFYRDGLPRGHAESTNKIEEKGGRTGGTKSRVTMIGIPEPSARALFEILQETAKRLKIKPIEPRNNLDKKELRALLAKHAPAVLKKMKA